MLQRSLFLPCHMKITRSLAIPPHNVTLWEFWHVDRHSCHMFSRQSRLSNLVSWCCKVQLKKFDFKWLKLYWKEKRCETHQGGLKYNYYYIWIILCSTATTFFCHSRSRHNYISDTQRYFTLPQCEKHFFKINKLSKQAVWFEAEGESHIKRGECMNLSAVKGYYYSCSTSP